MVRRTNRRDGSVFLGCAAYPWCRYTESIKGNVSVESCSAGKDGGNERFAGEFVVFDVETTGLSPARDFMVEIGALLIRDEEIVSGAVFHSYINPKRPIPARITKINGITDEMVKDAPDECCAVTGFLNFTGDRALVAHNAGFDMGFIRAAAMRNSLTCNLTCIDTVTLSRLMYPGLPNHKLNTLAEHFSLGNFDHHRADADAKMLSLIFSVLQKKMKKEYGVRDITSLKAAFPNSMK